MASSHHHLAWGLAGIAVLLLSSLFLAQLGASRSFDLSTIEQPSN
jgi:hypothetical protein